MDEANDGGSAFPVFTEQYNYGLDRVAPTTVTPGMSLRDYFAAKALPAYFSDGAGYDKADMAARWAYAVADEMLKARSATHD